MEKGCPKVKSGVKYMIPGAKVKNHDVLAHEWFLNFMPRPNMSIKEERKRLICEYWAGLWEYEVRNNPYGIIYKNIKLKQPRCYREK